MKLPLVLLLLSTFTVVQAFTSISSINRNKINAFHSPKIARTSLDDRPLRTYSPQQFQSNHGTSSLKLFRKANLVNDATINSVTQPNRIFQNLRNIMFAMLGTVSTIKRRTLLPLMDYTKTRKIKILLIIVMLFLLVDTIETKKRQRIDPTSEWGTYADNPQKRGRALFGLLGRISLLSFTAKVLSYIKVSSNRASKLKKVAGETFAEGLLRLGPLYIKMGQILSCRDKLLPDEWKSSMERLQDRVPAKSGEEALQLAYSAYDGGQKEFDSIFTEFNDVPIAAASLGQVHLAKLRMTNDIVAIKLQRPRLRDIYDKDLALMKNIAKTVDKFGGKAGEVGGVKQSWEEIFDDAEKILYREIDYRDEAENGIKFCSNFGLGVNGTSAKCTAKSLDGKEMQSAASWLRAPYVYNEVSNERSLVMEFIPSIKISDNDKLRKNGVTEEEKEFLAECLGRAYLRQFCCAKFFSTDPHAGNLGCTISRNEKGEKKSVQLVFYDFGQACTLNDDQAIGILDVIEGIMDYDVDKCVSAFSRMGVLSDDADLDKVRKKVANNFETGKIKVKQRKKRISSDSNNENESTQEQESVKEEITLSSTNSTSAKTENGDINDAEIMSFFTLPAEYAFAARALTQLDGVGKGLDQDFDFISATAPWLVEIKGGEKFLEDEVKKALKSILKKSTDFQKKFLKTAGFDPNRYIRRS